jgi:hypothetical protein
MWTSIAIPGMIIALAGLVWMAVAVVRCFSRDPNRRKWAYDNAPRAWLLAFAGWVCVVLSGLLLFLR